MPKRTYTPDEKKLVRRLLLIHAGNVPIVHHLTGFPKRTIHNWREQWDDDYELYTDALAQNLVSRANALAAVQSAPNADKDLDAASARTENSSAQFAQIRDNLMNHATALSCNLALGDDLINQRVHALSRLIDRILALDEVIGDRETEQTIRFEYSYGDEIYDSPPWYEYDMDTKEGFMGYVEEHMIGAVRDWKREMLRRQGIVDQNMLNDHFDEYLEEVRERLGYSVQQIDFDKIRRRYQ